VLATGRRTRRGHLDIFWTAGETGHLRMGLIVPRFQHNAVARNRLRRQLRELWRREFQGRIPAIDVVIRPRRDAYGAPFDTLRSDLLAWCGVVGA
jgi:ribonuclease P protein component